MDYTISMIGSHNDPINSGDMRSWFFYYKWRPGCEDETFFPVAETTFPNIREGDTLWFIMDGVYIGSVPVLRVCDDDINDRKEIWFDMQQQRPFVEGPKEDGEVLHV